MQMILGLIGLVSASAELYQWLTPREILHDFATGFGLRKETADARVEELARVMDLQNFIDRRCQTLSTGQAQRVNLAGALIHDPPVVLLDEPTRGLDVAGAKVVFDYVQLLRSAQKAVILCTHQLDEAERFCDRFGLPLPRKAAARRDVDGTSVINRPADVGRHVSRLAEGCRFRRIFGNDGHTLKGVS